MKQNNCFFLLIFFFYLTGMSKAYAQIEYGPLNLNAFGTLGGAWLSNEHVDYTQGVQPKGPGLSHNFDIGFDSRLGVQLNVSLTNSTLITAQTVIERQADNEYLPRLTLANIRQELGEHVIFRIGRIQSPLFLASDYRLANFSNPWARTPGVVYDLYPLTHLDSADLTLKHETILGTMSLNAGYGWLEYQFSTSSNGIREKAEFDLDDVVYANLKLDNGPWHYKLSFLHGRASVRLRSFEQFVSGLAMLDPSVASQISFKNQNGALYTAGFSYDSENWLVMGEWAIARLDEPSITGDTHGGYLTIAYHLKQWLPQLTVGYQATTNRRVHSTNHTVDAVLADINKRSQKDYFTVAVGLNYAVTDSVVLRGQADIIDPMNNSNGPYSNADAEYSFNDPDVDVLLSLTLDFIF
ncbi:MAG: hypothetical protein ACU85E_12040 [Gammaproteobacteria bacterium]